MKHSHNKLYRNRQQKLERDSRSNKRVYDTEKEAQQAANQTSFWCGIKIWCYRTRLVKWCYQLTSKCRICGRKNICETPKSAEIAKARIYLEGEEQVTDCSPCPHKDCSCIRIETRPLPSGNNGNTNSPLSQAISSCIKFLETAASAGKAKRS